MAKSEFFYGYMPTKSVLWTGRVKAVAEVKAKLEAAGTLTPAEEAFYLPRLEALAQSGDEARKGELWGLVAVLRPKFSLALSEEEAREARAVAALRSLNAREGVSAREMDYLRTLVAFRWFSPVLTSWDASKHVVKCLDKGRPSDKETAQVFIGTMGSPEHTAAMAKVEAVKALVPIAAPIAAPAPAPEAIQDMRAGWNRAQAAKLDAIREAANALAVAVAAA
jgi:hypothetical protein